LQFEKFSRFFSGVCDAIQTGEFIDTSALVRSKNHELC
jgi:hypothetical protein